MYRTVPHRSRTMTANSYMTVRSNKVSITVQEHFMIQRPETRYTRVNLQTESITAPARYMKKVYLFTAAASRMANTPAKAHSMMKKAML